MVLPAGPTGPRFFFVKRCYSSITPHFVLACDRQSLASQYWAQVGEVVDFCTSMKPCSQVSWSFGEVAQDLTLRVEEEMAQGIEIADLHAFSSKCMSPQHSANNRIAMQDF
jgi:hypothetical protein